MQRSGLLVVIAMILVAAATGVLVWTNFFGQNKASDDAGQAPSTEVVPGTSRESQLVNEMVSAASVDGYSATFSESDIGKWKIADGHKIERFGSGSTGAVFARLTSSAALDKASVAWPTLGLSATLPVEFANLASGRRVEIGFVARSSQSNGSSELSALYASRQAGNSGWQSFQLKPDFELYKFHYDVNPVEGGYTNGPMIVFHSDATGSGKSVEFLGMYVKALPK